MKKKEIIVVGLGPGGYENIPPRNIRILKEAEKVYLRTVKHPGTEFLEKEGINFETFDLLYEELADFGDIYHTIVERLLEAAENSSGSICYAVPGNPVVAETSVDILLKKAPQVGIDIKIISAASGLEAVYGVLKLDPTSGIFIADALKLDLEPLKARIPLLVTQVYNRLVASDLKLTLMEYYGDEHLVTLVRAAGVENEEIVETLPLYEIDRRDYIDHLTSLYVPGFTEAMYPLDPLVNVMDKLRSTDGCPWDKKQTHESLKRYLIEETYEVIEAIEENNMYKLREELGDLLLQIVFHAKLAHEKNIFTINDVILEITEKMIRRHPHVFKDLNLETSEEVLETWDEIKKKERKNKEEETILNVPRGIPALLRAEKLQAKAAKVGFDWEDISGVREKIKEEFGELEEAREEGAPQERIKEELGDLLFAIVNYARFLKVDPEEALTFTNNKFIKRFKYIEEKARQSNREVSSLSFLEMNTYWEEAKKIR